MGGEWGQGVPIRGAPGRFARETQAVLVMRTTGKGKEERQVGQGASPLSHASLAREARREDIWVLCRLAPLVQGVFRGAVRRRWACAATWGQSEARWGQWTRAHQAA